VEHVELMTVIGGVLGIVVDSLMGCWQLEDLRENIGGLAGRDAQGNMEGQDKA